MFKAIAITAVLAASWVFSAVIAGSAAAGHHVDFADQDAAPSQKQKSAKKGEAPQQGARQPDRQAPRDEDGSDQDDNASPDADDVPGCIFRKAPLELLV